MWHGGVSMFDTLASQLGAVFVVLVCTFAFVKGDESERFAAGAYVLSWFASMLLQRDGELYEVQWGVFAVDTVMLFVLGGLIWKSRKAWPVWAAACNLLIVMSHIVLMVDARPPMVAFITVVNLAGYGVLLSLAVGTFWAWQERRASGLE
ncbi:MAG: hypothetical protein JWR59_1028 [Brevundimonas sp.]|jgi:hypothetical protein|nr:hypothetical protein [Brevundimonas sp.]